jgi:hypothetical protein
LIINTEPEEQHLGSLHPQDSLRDSTNSSGHSANKGRGGGSTLFPSLSSIGSGGRGSGGGGGGRGGGGCGGKLADPPAYTRSPSMTAYSAKWRAQSLLDAPSECSEDPSLYQHLGGFDNYNVNSSPYGGTGGSSGPGGLQPASPSGHASEWASQYSDNSSTNGMQGGGCGGGNYAKM